ncbi:MAG: metallophosphoesterase [Lachnospiraceae bacterium]|nr:metallophosphoesterase [Lachnospiraceae bacterium]
MKKHVNISKIGQAPLVLLGVICLAVLAKHYEYPDIRVSHTEEVIIPGLQEEYEFLFLADLHLAIKTREDVGPYGDADTRIAAFSNAKGTVSAEQFPQWIAYANKHGIDAVLMGGDMIDYYSDANAEFLAGWISKLEMPYLFTIGNHELFSPWEESIPENSVIYGLFQNGDKSFQVLDYEEFAICAIDNEAYQVSEKALAEMRGWLEANPQKPVILLAHVPFYTENDRTLLETSVNVWGQALLIGEGEGTRDTTQVSRDFLNMILAKESPVVAIFTGDNHFYYKSNLTDSVPQWIAAPAYAGDGMVIKVRGM